ncbi:MAG: TonB-dependent receptor [Bacteroidales bacterium]|nr:MAG: TonB-dependent receptor [Bacteroidales bacterium]
MKKLIFILSALLISVHTTANENKIYFSGEYSDAAFELFVQSVMEQTGARFFYDKSFVKDIKITARGDNLELGEVLDNFLSGIGLFYYIDKEKNVFVTGKVRLITSLPEYSFFRKEQLDTVSDDENGLTDIEKMYIEGRKSTTTKIINIGQRSSNPDKRPVTIRGRIKDKETGEPLIGATVYIEELSEGYATDVNGRFFIHILPGRYNTFFNCLGMQEEHYDLHIYSTGELNVDMVKTLIPINEVTIKAQQYDKVRSMNMGFEHLTAKTIKEIPFVLGEKDVIKVAQMLPGVQNVGEGSSGVYVRGSAADQNMFFINKVPVYNPSHLFGFFSSFSPDIIKDFSFYKSNIPAKYGSRLSSFFDISARQGNKKRYTARGGISPITGHLAVEGPIKKEKSSFVVSGRSTYSDWLLRRLHDADLRNSEAYFYDLATSLNFEINEKNIAKVFGYYSEDKFTLGTTNKYEYSNAGASVNWWHQYSSSLSSDISAAYGSYSFSTVDSTVLHSAYKQDYKIDHFEFRNDFIWDKIVGHRITFGANFVLYKLDRGKVLPAGPISLRKPVYMGKENGLEGAVYIADEFRLLPRLTLYSGIRYSFFALTGPMDVFDYIPGSPRNSEYITDTLNFTSSDIVKFYSGPEYRASLKYSTGQYSSVKFSYNRTRQYIFMLSNTIAISPTDQWKLADYHIIPPCADQISAGFYKDLSKLDITFSSEIYYKKTKNIVEYKDGASFISSPFIESEVLQGNQTAYGLELMIKKNSGRLTGWLSATLSKSETHVDGNYSWEKINEGLAFPSNYDKPVALNTVINFRMSRRLSISSNIVYNSGRPVTYPISLYYIERQEHYFYSSRNKYRIPDYFRVDLSFNLEGNLKAKKLGHSFWMLNFYNLTGRKNAYSVYFKSEDGKMKGYKLSIFGIPVVTVSWNFKFGNYASD